MTSIEGFSGFTGICWTELLTKKKASGVLLGELYVVRPGALDASEIKKKLTAVHAAKASAWEAAAPLIDEVLALEEKLEAAAQETKGGNVAQLRSSVKRFRAQLDPAAEALSRTDRQLAELESGWGQVREGQSMSVLGRLLRAEAVLNHDDSAVFEVSSGVVYASLAQGHEQDCGLV